jgi:hypothetical protein
MQSEMLSGGLVSAGREWIVRHFSWEGLRTLVLLGVGMQVVYLVFFVLTSVFSVRAPSGSEQPLDLPALLIWMVSYLAFMGLLFVGYCYAIKFVRRVPADRVQQRNWILLFAGVSAVILLFLPALFSHDLFSYIIYGRIVSVYGNNPYTTVPIEVATDPFQRFVDWKGVPSVYGPVWTTFSAVLTYVGGSNVQFEILAFKFAAVVLHLSNVYLIWQILTKLDLKWRAAGTLLYAWNPLTVIEFAGNGHNDVMMLFFVLLAVYAYVQQKRYLGLVFLTLSVLTKFITIVLVPMYVFLLLRKEPDNRARGLVLAKSGLVVGVLFFGFWLPFWAGFSTIFALKGQPALSEYVNSLPQVGFWLIRSALQVVLPMTDLQAYSMGDTIVRDGAMVIFFAYWLKVLFETKSFPQMLGNWFKVLVFYLVFVGTWFWPWYVTWLVVLAALGDRPRTMKLTILFSFSVLLAYALWPLPPSPLAVKYPLSGLAIFGIPAVVLLYEFLVRRKRRRLGPAGLLPVNPPSTEQSPSSLL